MGSTESKIHDVDEQLLRHQFMKDVVRLRHAFTAAHAGYAMSLKNTGAALSYFTYGEFYFNLSSVPPASAVSPETNGLKKGDRKISRKKPLTLIQIFAQLTDHCFQAFESTREVSNMLVAIKLQFNPNPIDHLENVMYAISWNSSFQGMPSVVGDFSAEESESYATVSDEMLAWEKKLYDELKAGEILKYEYQKKVALLSMQKKRGSNKESLEKLKASVCQLHTRYIVDMQSVDSIVAEINRVRDERLYPKLVELVDGMATMWETMRCHHEIQARIAYALKPLDILQPLREHYDYEHYDRTFHLYAVVNEWHKQFCRLLDYQKDYVRALCYWLKLNLLPIRSNLKENVSSPSRVVNLPIQELLLAWNDDLDKLPDELARSAMSNFAAVLQAIMYKKEEVMKMGEKCEATRKEIDLKSRQYHDWCMKNGVNEEMISDNPLKTAKEEKEAVLISLEEDERAHLHSWKRAREKSFASIKCCLPELFRAMSEFALACSVMYSNLRSIAENT